jgi:hypothetical protein
VIQLSAADQTVCRPLVTCHPDTIPKSGWGSLEIGSTRRELLLETPFALSQTSATSPSQHWLP